MSGRKLFKDLKNYKIVFVILFIGITSRLIFSVFFSPIPSSGNTGDTVHYYESAVSLTEGKGYTFNGKPTANFPPGYSLVLAVLFKLFFPSYKLAQLLNVILGTISCLLIYLICKKISGERAAILALGIMALSPANIVWAGVVFSENLFLPLLLGTILLWTYLIQEGIPSFSKVDMGGLLKLILSGILLGLASLTRGQAVLLPGVLFLWILFNRKSFSSALITALIVSLSMIFTVLPWTMRNKEVFGSYKLISTNGGINLLIGNHRGATGGYHDPEDGYPGGDDEVLKDRLCKEMALSYIFSNPINFMKLIPKKIFFLWGADSTFTFRYELLAKLPHAIGYFLLAASHILYYLLFFAAAAAIIMFKMIWNRDDFKTAVLLVLLFLYFSAFHAIFFAGPRYNYPFYPFLVILASGSIDIWIKSRIRTVQQ